MFLVMRGKTHPGQSKKHGKYIELLRDLNAHDVPFFERNIRGHLEGVYRVLENWGADDDLAAAGLFHAIYLTDFFECNQPDQINRSRVRAVIGEVAEELAYCKQLYADQRLFCHLRTLIRSLVRCDCSCPVNQTYISSPAFRATLCDHQVLRAPVTKSIFRFLESTCQ